LKKYTVIVSNQAEKELNEIFDYIKDTLLEPTIAKKLLHKFLKSIIELETFPERFPIVDDEYFSRLNIRKCVVENYIIIYRVNTDISRVDISHIFYSARDWMKLL